MIDNNAPAKLKEAVDRRPLGPGQLLREGRERKQLSVRAVADALHLSTHVVESLEEERFADLPPLTFVKGYLRAYASLVEVPQEMVMEAFEDLGLDEEERVPSPVPDTQVAASGRPSGLFWMVLVLLLAGAAFAAWWLRAPAPAAETGAGTGEPAVGADLGAAAEAPPESTQPRAAAPESNAQPTPDALAAAEPESGADSSPLSAAPEGGVSASGGEPAAAGAPTDAESRDNVGVQTQAAADEGAAAQDTAPESGLDTDTSAAAGALTLTVSGESWIEVRDANGKRLLYGLIQGPVTRHVGGQAPFSLVIGDADRVQLVYQGEDVPLQQFTKGNVARFQWPPDH